MEASFLPPRYFSHQGDTSLALPLRPSTEADSTKKNVRVQHQVQITIRRKTMKGVHGGGVNFEKNTTRSLDGSDGFFSNTKVNRRDYNSLSLKDTRAKRVSSRMSASPTPNAELSYQPFNYSLNVQGSAPLTKHDHLKMVGALMDFPDGSTLARQHTLSESRRCIATRASVPRPGASKNMSLTQSTGGRYLSASTGVQQGLERMSGRPQLDGGFTRVAQVSQRKTSKPPTVGNMGKDERKQIEARGDGRQMQKQTAPPQMTIHKALSLLSQSDEENLIKAIRYIQSQCFERENARNMVFCEQGVEKLLPLLSSENEEVQCAAAAALRNVVYLNNDNKTNVKNGDGLTTIINALKNTRDKDTIHQLAGLLWNLSSDDTIKELFSNRFLRIITNSILVPSSGLKTAENPKDEMIADSKAFVCATGCLRNLSSAGTVVRSNMRKCENLIDSLVYYIRDTTASRTPNDKSTENCVCTLQNLTYLADLDNKSETSVPQQHAQQETAPKETTVGCFPHCSAKLTKDVRNMEAVENGHSPQDREPQGAEWLWSQVTVRTYLSLVACSSSSSTRQAALGALLNLTAGTGAISKNVALTIIENKGAQEIARVFGEEDSELQKMALWLTRNLSCHPECLLTIYNELLPGVLKVLDNLEKDTTASSKEELSPYLILIELSKNSEKMANSILDDLNVQKLLKSRPEGLGYRKTLRNQLLITMQSYAKLRHRLRSLNILQPKGVTKKKWKYIDEADHPLI